MYEKTEWVAGGAPGVSAQKLNKMEKGIYDASVENDFGGLNSRVTVFGDGRISEVARINLGSRLSVGSGTYADPYRTSFKTYTADGDFETITSVQLTANVNTSTPTARDYALNFREIVGRQIKDIQAVAVSASSADLDVYVYIRIDGYTYVPGLG